LGEFKEGIVEEINGTPVRTLVISLTPLPSRLNFMCCVLLVMAALWSSNAVPWRPLASESAPVMECKRNNF